MDTSRKCSFIAIAIALLFPVQANAWMRHSYSDSELVEGAELIVIGHLQENTLTYVPHVAPNGGGTSFEHRAVLVVTEVLNGHAIDSNIPIIIHYGLTPVVGGYIKNDYMMLNARGLRSDYPQDVIEIFDTGNSAVSLSPVTGDLRKDQIWFLRVQQNKEAKYSGQDDTDALGIWDPENIQSAELKLYFQAYLGDHLENRLQEYSMGNSPLAIRSRQGLAHLKMQAALQEPDLTKRAELLLPFYLFTEQKPDDPTHWEATINMRFHCGKAGAARLVSIFNDPKYKVMQTDIMYVWEESGYTECLPIVTNLLRTENQFWVDQSREQLNLWNDIRPGHSPTAEQSESENRIQAALSVMRRFADPQTRPTLEETRQLWETLHVDTVGNNVLKGCDEALAAIDKPEPHE